MKMKKVSLGKEFKCGLPNFSNVTSRVDIEWEVGEEEDFDFTKAWDIINQQISIQGNDIDSSWIKIKELKDKFTATISIPKTGEV